MKSLPLTKMHHGAAAYVDPLLPKTAKIFVPFAKHLGYSYQEEHRFCWILTKPAMQLSHVDVEVGPLRRSERMGFARMFISICPTAGYVGSAWTATCRIIPTLACGCGESRNPSCPPARLLREVLLSLLALPDIA